MKQNLLKYFVLWLGICLATACSEEELPESQDGWCNVSLQVTTGAVETKAYGGDTYANPHEFIHSLCLFIVNEQGKIEKKIYPKDLESTSPADQGNLLNWTSPHFEIPEGTKTVYAFANWETAESDKWNAIIAKTDKDQLTANDLNIAVNLNGKINLDNNKFIPMSGKTTVTLAANADRSIPITLTRLVSRVEVRLTNKHTDNLTMSAESMGNFADAVTLFEDLGTVSGRNQEIVRTGTTSITQNGSDSWVFYVNETKGENSEANKFHIKMKLNDNTYDTPTQRTDLPRNSVYHLVFTYSEYQLTLAAKAQIAPIGVLPIEVYNKSSLTNEYMLELPEGCTFSIKPSIKKNGSPLSGTVSWEWTINTNSTSLVQRQETGGDIFNGYLTAQIGQDATLTLKPTSTASGEESLPEYTITIRPVALPDLPSASLFGLSPWGSRLRSAECFNLIVNGKEDKQ